MDFRHPLLYRFSYHIMELKFQHISKLSSNGDIGATTGCLYEGRAQQYYSYIKPLIEREGVRHKEYLDSKFYT